ncbi:MAG: hypothetical protein IH983_12865 [Planctomycetes bacterium]|nr:hypothetical protein [Planctomycetota bacterium]
MRVLIDREFVVHAVIALAVCIGAWMFVVDPKVQQLHDVEAMIEQRRARFSAMNDAVIEQLAIQAATIRARSDEIESRGRLAADTALMYGLIMRLADEHGVQVQTLRPQVESKSRLDQRIVVTRIDVTMKGSFEKIASFLGALDGAPGYLRPSSLHITPTQQDGRPLVGVRLGCEALSFALPEAVAGVRGVSDDDA